jgi:hypothetical protein
MTIFGWDLSHYDAPGIGDAVAEGFTFFTHKAGGDANDAEIGTWWSGVKGLSTTKALLGAYWVLYPGSAASRADQFLARLDATCSGWRNRPFILQVDCEEWSGDASTVPTKSDIKTFCDRLVAKMPKLKPIVYAPEWVYGDKLSGLGYPLWASSYVSGSGAASKLYPGDSSSKWHAYSGQTPAILQFTSSATIAGQTTCDANAYRGSLAQLTALVAPGWKAEDVELTDKIGDEVYPNRTVGDVFRDLAKLRGFLVGDVADTKNAAIKAAAPSAEMATVPTAVAAVPTADENAAAVLAALSAGTPEESAAVLKGVLGDQAAAVGKLLAAG